MSGYEADIAALEQGISQVVQPAIDRANRLADQLRGLGDLDRHALTGVGSLAGVALDAVCMAAGATYEEGAAQLHTSQRKFAEALGHFEASLRQVVARYRGAEEQHQATLERLAEGLGD